MDLEEQARFQVDADESVLVVWVGGDVGCHEFAIERQGEIVELSQRGYAHPATALRDGLSYWLGDVECQAI